jgi:hypothetical protein
MSERTDRTIRSNWIPLSVVIVLVAVAAGGGVYLWMRMSDPAASRKPSLQGRQPLTRLVRRDEPLSVTLYYPAVGMLTSGAAAIVRQPDTQSQAREAITALFTDQQTSQASALREVKLRSFYVDASGGAYVDLTPARQKDVRASAWEEYLIIYAVVNTLTQNFEEIKQVRFLLDGKEAQTLAGHMDLSRMFMKRMDLVKQ